MSSLVYVQLCLCDWVTKGLGVSSLVCPAVSVRLGNQRPWCVQLGICPAVFVKGLGVSSLVCPTVSVRLGNQRPWCVQLGMSSCICATG